jgi:MFS family permease
MPMMVGLIIASVLAGQIVSQTGKYKALTIVGMVVTVLAMALFTQIGTGTSNASLSWRMVILGIGIGIGMPIFTTVAQSAFGPERLGEVTAGKQLFQNIGGTVSTAILGGVMNNQLAHQLTNIQNDSFVATIKQLNPAAAFTKIDVNTIQEFLSTEGQVQMKTMLAKAPQAMQGQLAASLSHFLNTIKTALSYAVDHMFIVSTILMCVALFIVFFLPQIPLRKHKHQTLEEIEFEVGNELGAQSDAEHNQDH